MSMYSFQNYYMMVMTGSTWGIMVVAFIVPPPYNLGVFLLIYPVNIGVLVIQPKVARWVANLRKHKWITIDSDRDLWTWPASTMQVWYDQDPAQLSEPIFDSNGRFVEWQTFLILRESDAIRHPYYNDRRKIWGIFFRHGDYSFDHTEIELTEDERKSLSAWQKLMPGAGGWVSFAGVWVKHSTSDSIWADELMPSAEEQAFDEENANKVDLLNHIPIVRDGVAYPVLRIKRATGSYLIEHELRRAKRIPAALAVDHLGLPAPSGNGQATSGEVRTIKVPVKIIRRAQKEPTAS